MVESSGEHVGGRTDAGVSPTSGAVPDAAPVSTTPAPTSTSPSGTGSADAPPPPDLGSCANAIPVPLGGTVQGTTCGATHVGDSICQQGNPDAFIYVDAPVGQALHLVATTGMSMMAFPHCDSLSANECVYGGGGSGAGVYDPSDPSVRLFEIERVDNVCGTFSVTVTAR